MPSVSIIIPMYNEERYIARCLESLTHQSFQNFEIILIDDGSTDKTVKIAETFKSSFLLTILHQKHAGPGKARNRGAKGAKGEILVFVDADMFFDQHYLKYLITPIQSGKEVGTSHGTELVGNLENPLARAYGLTRGIFDDNTRGGVFRAFDKKTFLQSAGYNADRYAFEDDFTAKIGTALFVKNAICYHNNPEHLSEIFHHEIWIGESLIAKGQMKEYSKKYALWISTFLLLGILAGIWCIWQKIGRLIPIIIIGVLLLLVLLKTLQRTIKERYLSHLIYVPLVMSTRGLGYIYGILKFLIRK